MIISPFILVTCCIAMMALGIGVVYKAVSHPPRGGKSEISAFGSKLVLKGPAWLIMIAVGAVITATPIIAAVVQRESQVPFQPSAPAQAVSKIQEPEYHDFRFIRDVSYLDLRNSRTQPWYTYLPGWKRVVGNHSRIRPASLLNYMLIRKVGPSNEIHITYSTSGSLDLRCLTHPYKVKTADDNGQFMGELTIDVRSVPIDTDFTLITEVTYWNAFSGEGGDDFTTYTHDQHDQSEEVALIVVFPDAKPFTGIDVLEQPPDSSMTRRFDGTGQKVSGSRNQTFYWSSINVAQGRWFYTVRWTW